MKQIFIKFIGLICLPFVLGLEVLNGSNIFTTGVIAQNPLIGKARNKLGNVVFSTIFGKCVVKSKALKVHNPRTPKQRFRREQFSVALEFIQPLIALLQIGWREMAIGMSAFNACMSYTRLNALTGATSSVVVDITKFLISKGSLMGFDGLVVTAPSANSINLSWDDNSGYGNALATDLVRVAIYEPLSKKWITEFATETRSTTSVDVTIPAAWAGKTVKVFAFFVQATGKNASIGNMVASIQAHA